MWENQASAEETAEIVNASNVTRQKVSGYVVNEPESQLLQAAAEEERPSEPQVIAAAGAPPDSTGPEDPFADNFQIAADRASTVVEQPTTDSPLPTTVLFPETFDADVQAPEPSTQEAGSILVETTTESPNQFTSEESRNGLLTFDSEAGEGVKDVSKDISSAVAFPSSSQDNETGPTEIDNGSSIPILSPKPQVQTSPGPVAFPSGDAELTQSAPPTPVPVAFPSSTPAATHHQSVTFSSGIATPPRSGTPDHESKVPKRIRKTSQNIQKFARSLSFAGKRQSTSSSITKVDGTASAPVTAGPGTPRSSREDNSVTRVGASAGGEGSIGGDSGSSLGPERDDKDKDKEQRKSRLLKGRKSTK